MNLEDLQALCKGQPGKYWQLCHDIIEVFYAVYNELGYGFLEAL